MTITTNIGRTFALLAGGGLAAGAAATAATAATTQRVSVATGGAQGNAASGGVLFDERTAVSADGRRVAFVSRAANLVPGDTNGAHDVFVRDRAAGTTRRVSVATGGGQADGPSVAPALSADGRYVAFASGAGNLVPGDTNDRSDVFVHDLATGATRRVSVGAGGAQADDNSEVPDLSGDGRLVAFTSYATNLVAGDTNGAADVFVRDLATGSTLRASVSGGGVQGDLFSGNPSLSADGRKVAFHSTATNLVPDDTNGATDVFVRNLAAGTTRRVSVGAGGAQGNGNSGSPDLSADGRLVAFDSQASNLVAGDTNATYDVFVGDLDGGRVRRVSLRAGGGEIRRFSTSPAISADGRRVAFLSKAANVVPGDTNGKLDVFVRDLAGGTTERVSVAAGGAQGNGDASYAALSADGSVAAFASAATNLVPNDTNGAYDVFVRAR